MAQLRQLRQQEGDGHGRVAEPRSHVLPKLPSPVIIPHRSIPKSRIPDPHCDRPGSAELHIRVRAAETFLPAPGGPDRSVDPRADTLVWLGEPADLRATGCPRVVANTDGKVGGADEGYGSGERTAQHVHRENEDLPEVHQRGV